MNLQVADQEARKNGVVEVLNWRFFSPNCSIISSRIREGTVIVDIQPWIRKCIVADKRVEHGNSHLTVLSLQKLISKMMGALSPAASVCASLLLLLRNRSHRSRTYTQASQSISHARIATSLH